jgi:hypothetical protein
MPARTGPGVVISHEIGLETEVVVDAMCQVGFINLATSIRFRGDDVVFRLGEVEPVFRSLIELEADLTALDRKDCKTCHLRRCMLLKLRFHADSNPMTFLSKVELRK